MAKSSVERILAFDPGAIRMGWILLRRSEKYKNKPPVHDGLGYFGVPREVNGSKTKFQPYRLSVLDLWIEKAPILIDRYKPDKIISEIVPPVGGGNFVVATQSHLALCAIVTVEVIAKQHDIPLFQVGATTIKTHIGGNKEASKVKVRNGVFKIMPTLEEYKKEWTKIFEISDAAATGLTYWEYKNEHS